MTNSILETLLGKGVFGFFAGEAGLERSSVARHVVVRTRGDMGDQNLIVYNIDVFEGTQRSRQR